MGGEQGCGPLEAFCFVADVRNRWETSRRQPSRQVARATMAYLVWLYGGRYGKGGCA